MRGVISQVADEIKCLLVDLDGTVYLGDKLINGALKLRDATEEKGIQVFFMTNNSSRSVKFYSEKLTRLGWPVGTDSILSSQEATALELSRRGTSRVYAVGTESLVDELERFGLEVHEGYDESAQYVVVGFDTTLAYEKLVIAGKHIQRGVPVIATHPDTVCPVGKREFIPDCGAIIACLKTAYEHMEVEVMGKPEAGMVKLVESRTPFRGKQIGVVGDRLYTDMKFGKKWGMRSVLVLSGETNREDITEDNRPDIVIDHVGVLADMLLNQQLRFGA